MSFSIQLGNFLYKHAFVLYKPMYTLFKNRQDVFEIELLKKHIHSGDTVLDIGANIGYYAEILSSIVGEKGQVHCFEPDAKNFGYLKKATQALTNCVITNKAVGPKTEKLKIYTSKNLNVDHRTYKPEDFDQELEIDAVSMDDYMHSHSVPIAIGILSESNANSQTHRDSNNETLKQSRWLSGQGSLAKAPVKINFIKMDIQGFEMQALQGMKKTLRENPDIKIISEFWPYGLRKAGSSVTLYFEELTRLGFTCYLLEKKSLKKLSLKDVQALEPLGEEQYFNILASRTDV